jgi:hypothetical protein
MRRILLIVAMLLVAAPAMAGVTIKARHLPRLYAGPPLEQTCCGVEVNFTSDSAGQVRAFALDINVDSNFIIRAIRDFNSGVSTQNTPCVRGYGIFPGSFRDVLDGADPCFTDPNYNPVAPAADCDANHQGLGTSGVTVELGSLYYGDANKPTQNGMLFRLEVIPRNFGAAKGNLHLAVNTARGGVVDANGNGITDVNLVGCEVNYPDCFPCWTPYGAAVGTQYTEWKTVGQPSCWCAQGTAGNAVFNWKTQCKGDADGKYESGSKYRVFTSDYTKLVACWGKKTTQMKFDPNCICADFDHKYESGSKYRVFTSDYTIMVANWGKKETQIKPWCPVP